MMCRWVDIGAVAFLGQVQVGHNWKKIVCRQVRIKSKIDSLPYSTQVLIYLYMLFFSPFRKFQTMISASWNINLANGVTSTGFQFSIRQYRGRGFIFWFNRVRLQPSNLEFDFLLLCSPQTTFIMAQWILMF